MMNTSMPQSWVGHNNNSVDATLLPSLSQVMLGSSDDFFGNSTANSSTAGSPVFPPNQVNTSTTTPMTTPTTTHGNKHGDGDSMWWASTIVFLLIWCAARPSIQDDSHRRAALARYKERKSPDRRKKVVESNLITKRVIACDENKALQLGDISGSISLEEYSITSLEEEDVAECPICLEVFRKGDYVTWSKSMECLHVFHQECLEGWLSNVKHNNCPSCRVKIIHEDGDSKGQAVDNSEDEPPSSLAYVIMNGLVSPLRRARDSIVGSSINLDDDGSIISNSSQGPFDLRRVFSSGASDSLDRQPSMLGIALRRVSSGIYSTLNGTFDDSLNDSHRNSPGLDQSIELRRTRSEGITTTPRVHNTSDHELGHSNSNGNDDLVLDLELGDSSEFEPDVSRPALIMRLGMRRSYGLYSKIESTYSDGDFMEDISDDEDSIEPRNPWRDHNIVDEEEGNLEEIQIDQVLVST